MGLWRRIFFTLTVIVTVANANETVSISDIVKPSDFYGVTISPDGNHLAMIVNPNIEDKPYKRSLRIIDLRSNKEVSFLNFPKHFSISEVTWANNERVLIEGSQKWQKYSIPVSDPNLVAVNIDGSKQETIFGPMAGKANLSSVSARKSNAAIEEYASFYFLQRLPETPEFVLGYKVPWTWNENDDWNSYVIKLNVYNGKQETLEKLPFKRAYVTVDNTGKARFVTTYSEKLEIELFYRPASSDSFTSVQKYFDSEGGWQPVRFLPDNEHVIVNSDKDSEFSGVYKLNPDTGAKSLVAYDTDGDMGALEWSEGSNELLGYWKNSTIPSLTLINNVHGESVAYSKFQKAFPGKQVKVTSATDSGSKSVVAVYSDIDPANYFLFDSTTGKASKIGSTRPWMDKKALAKMKAVSITARDGLKLPSYLTVPNNVKPEGLPMVLLVHGGPYGVRDEWEYNEDVQVLASQGYAVLQVNYRGSGGFGRAFKYGAYRQWGKQMQDDLVDAVNWAVTEKLVDPKRVCIMGHSYGGYAAVWGAIRDKGVYACAIGSMGAYDLSYIFEERETKESARAIEFYKQTLGTDMEELKRLSPVYNADKLEIPLLLSHGEEDRTVPIEHAERMRKALDKARKRYEWMEFEDAGHFFGSEKNRVHFYTKVVEFLNKNIGNKEVK